jgi:hypothetical protein
VAGRRPPLRSKEIHQHLQRGMRNLHRPVNLFGGPSDERLGSLFLEGVMIIQSLITTFAIAFLAIAAFGHILLLQAMFAPKQRPPQTDEQPSRDAPVSAARIAA